MITVRYFAAAEAAAGVTDETVPTDGPIPLVELIEELGRRHGGALPGVLAAASFLIDEVVGPRDRVIPAGAVVDVLPPFAGG